MRPLTFSWMVVGMQCAAYFAAALENGVGRVPAMGWNSWNTFRCEITEDVIKEVADAVVSTGLAGAGYRYVNIDDCWMERERDPSTGQIVPSKRRFPSGMKALGDYLHSKKLLFGIYSSSGDTTCEGLPGSWGHEEQDARSYAEWGVDYLKYDFCGMEKHRDETARTAYARMRDALTKATATTGRPILYSLCSWGSGSPHRWGAAVSNSWRTGRDMFAVWDAQGVKDLALPGYMQSVLEAVDGQKLLAKYAGPGAFNDPDMLVVGLDGMYPYGMVQRCPPTVPDCKPGEYISRERWGMVGGLSFREQRAHFSLWAIMAAPLLLGNDPRDMTPETRELLTAPEVIAVNQDSLGLQGQVTHAGNSGSVEVWSKPLADGSFALLLLNRGEAPANVTASWDRDIPAGRALAPEGPAECKGEPDECEGWASSGECERNPSFMSRTCNCSCRLVAGVSQGATMGSDFGLEDNRPAVVRDLWQQKNLGVFYSAFSATIQPHAVRMVRVSFDLEANLAGQQEGGSHEAASEAVTDEPKFHEISEVHNTVQILSTGESHQGPGYCGGCSIWVTLLITENAVLLLLLAVYHIPAVQRRRSPPKADNLRL